MSSIVLPQVLVYQQFQAVPSELTDPLRAFIFGPEYDLHRYTTSEKAKAGVINSIQGTTVTWSALGKRTGSVVDQDYTKVYIEDALLEYWDQTAGAQYTSGNYSPVNGYYISNPAGHPNRLKFDGINLVDKTDYPLHSSFYDRDVQIGDYVKGSAYINNVQYTFGGNVTGFVAETVASSIGSVSYGANNKSTIGSAASSTALLTNTVTETTSTIAATSISVASYSGLIDGLTSDVYTVTVVQGSIGGLPSTMILNIVSASGKDTVLGYVPTTSDWTQSIPLGTNGATFKFNQSGSSNVPVGNAFTITVNQAYTAPTGTTSGTYTGTADTTYVVRFVSGGDAYTPSATRPVVKITTTTGVDSYPETSVTASGSSTLAITVGKGVTLTLNRSQICGGEEFYVPVTAAGEGAIQTLVMDTNLPDALITTGGNGGIIVDLSVQLCIKKNLELHSSINGDDNWTQTATSITVEAGANEADSSWREGAESLPIVGGDIYVHWRELVTDRSDQIYSINQASDIDDIFDTVSDPDNPLVYAANKAILNSGSSSAPSTGIRVMAVPTNDADGYTSVLTLAEARNDLYSFVPLTQDTAIQDLVAEHVIAQSLAEIGQWRIAIFSPEEDNPTRILYQNTNASAVLATTDSDGVLTLDSESTASFVTAGVIAGDVVRIGYGLDSYSETVYEEYVVDEVNSASILTLTTAPSPVYSTAVKIEIWRTLNATKLATHIGTKAERFYTTYGDDARRLYCVYPSEIESGGTLVKGYFLCAAIAGLIGASAPQQGLTNVEVKGFDNAKNIINRFSRTNLDSMANDGVWIVTQDLSNGSLYTRHQLSTNVTDVNKRELNIVKNVDSISYVFQNRLKRFIGRANVTQTTIDIIRTQLDGTISYLQSAGFNALTGGQVLSGTKVTQLRPHTILKDRLVVTIELVIPYPINNIELTLVV